MLTGLGMIEKLLQTYADFACTFLRTIAGIIIFPCGMQKLLGWFDGVGIKRTLEQRKVRKIPQFIETCPEFRSEMPDAIFRIATSFSESNSNRFGERRLPMEIIKGFHLSARNQPNKKCKQIIGNSAALESVLSGVECVAPTDSTVLVLGETGTGKELIARAIHNMSGRRGRPFVTLSCA